MLQRKAAGTLPAQGGHMRRTEVDLDLCGRPAGPVHGQQLHAAGRWARRSRGVYGACSTMAEALGLGAAFAACRVWQSGSHWRMTSSHFCAAERQFRTPLEYGAKRTPTAQWTATAAGACLVRGHGGQGGVPVLSATFGRVQDFERDTTSTTWARP